MIFKDWLEIVIKSFRSCPIFRYGNTLINNLIWNWLSPIFQGEIGSETFGICRNFICNFREILLPLKTDPVLNMLPKFAKLFKSSRSCRSVFQTPPHYFLFLNGFNEFPLYPRRSAFIQTVHFGNKYVNRSENKVAPLFPKTIKFFLIFDLMKPLQSGRRNKEVLKDSKSAFLKS